MEELFKFYDELILKFMRIFHSQTCHPAISSGILRDSSLKKADYYMDIPRKSPKSHIFSIASPRRSFRAQQWSIEVLHAKDRATDILYYIIYHSVRSRAGASSCMRHKLWRLLRSPHVKESIAFMGTTVIRLKITTKLVDKNEHRD